MTTGNDNAPEQKPEASSNTEPDYNNISPAQSKANGHAALTEVERFAASFGGRRANRYASALTPPDPLGKVKPVKVDNWCEPPTVALWDEHLRGEITLGILTD